MKRIAEAYRHIRAVQIVFFVDELCFIIDFDFVEKARIQKALPVISDIVCECRFIRKDGRFVDFYFALDARFFCFAVDDIADGVYPVR